MRFEQISIMRNPAEVDLVFVFSRNFERRRVFGRNRYLDVSVPIL